MKKLLIALLLGLTLLVGCSFPGTRHTPYYVTDKDYVLVEISNKSTMTSIDGYIKKSELDAFASDKLVGKIKVLSQYDKNHYTIVSVDSIRSIETLD